MTVTQVQLKPCPFCGSVGAKTIYVMQAWSVTCERGAGIDEYDTESEAITAWNTRASEDAERPLLERIEVLEAALKEYIGGCTNEECIYCINARQALGETQ